MPKISFSQMFKRDKDNGSVSQESRYDSTPAPAPVDPRDRPANFDEPDYRPGGLERVPFPKPAFREFNTAFLFDDSGSMGGWWERIAQYLAVILDAILQNDDDGIDWYFINHKTKEKGDPENGIAKSGYNGIKNPDYIVQMFREMGGPNGLTFIGERIKLILEVYIARYKLAHNNPHKYAFPKPLNLIVWTDGLADDEEVFKRAIVKAAEELDDMDAPERQLGVQLLQVGRSGSVRTYFKQLDDHLHELSSRPHVRDIVDTKSYAQIDEAGGFEPKFLLPILGGAMLKSQDRKEDVF